MNDYLIDREARNAMAEQLRHLLAGRITNDQFEDRMPVTSDRAVHGAADAAWGLYDDLHEHTLTGKFAPSSEARRTMARVVLFLKTDQPWPHSSGAVWVLITFSTVVLLGFVFPAVLLLAFLASLVISRIVRSRNAHAADRSYYPFGSEEAFRDARAKPPYLKGSAG